MRIDKIYSDLYYLWKHGMIVVDNDGCKSDETFVDDEQELDDGKVSMVENCAAKDGEEKTEMKIL